MQYVIDPGQGTAIANLIITLAGAFVFGLPLLLVVGSRWKSKKQLLILTSEELAYESAMFGVLE
tara:strand:+ start:2590 stop:2781 length:192 start_codon:yes stop_codon:yes gene_type:complete